MTEETRFIVFALSRVLSDAEHDALQIVGKHAGEIAHEDNPGDVLHVPSKRDFLKSHHDHACGRADDEHGTSHAGAVGEELPEDAVLGEVARFSHGIHSHAACHERHVVHDAGEHADDAGDGEVVAVKPDVQSAAEQVQCANLFQCGDSHEDAEEEENRAHVDAGEHVGHAFLHATFFAGFRQVTIEHLRHGPEHAQHEQDADEGRQVCDAFEDGNEDETADAEEEDEFSLHAVQVVSIGDFAGVFVFAVFDVAFQFCLQQQCGNHHGDDGRHEDFLDDAGCGDESFVPKHDGGHVADGREGTAAVGCDDDEGGINQAVTAFRDEFAQNHNHHDACGEVVKDGGEDEGEPCDSPKEFPLAFCFEHVSHEVESPVLVHELHDGHGSHEEEERGGSASEVVFDGSADDQGNLVAHGIRKILCGVNHEKSPTPNEHQQGNRCFVDFRHTLDGNEEIAQDKCCYNADGQCGHVNGACGASFKGLKVFSNPQK